MANKNNKHNGKELPTKHDYGDVNSGNNWAYDSYLNTDDILNMTNDEFLKYQQTGNYKITTGRNIN